MLRDENWTYIYKIYDENFQKVWNSTIYIAVSEFEGKNSFSYLQTPTVKTITQKTTLYIWLQIERQSSGKILEKIISKMSFQKFIFFDILKRVDRKTF